ncbi:MAG: K(+)-transporting ATPase subunit C [Bryobacteraceae bacterium]
MWKQMMPGLRMTILLTVLTGLIYPGVVTVICQILFPAQANGSLVYRGGKVAGSSLLGQNFTRPEYFHPRPSAAGSDGYDASASGGSNLGPASQKLIDRVKASAEKTRAEEKITQFPADMLTASASGLDPHVSPASAQLQASRVAAARGASPAAILSLVAEFTEGRDLGFLGEARVNVLLLNLKLDEKFPFKK